MTWLLLLLAAFPPDPIPYFKPDCSCTSTAPAPFVPAPPHPYNPPPPHPIAYECAIDDAACIQRHDDQAVLWASTFGLEWCDEATDVDVCRTTVRALEWDYTPRIDPCLWVVRIDGEWATLLKPANGRTLVVHAQPGWKPKAFTGGAASRCGSRAGDPSGTPPREAHGAR
jgi:hypothetical protein